MGKRLVITEKPSVARDIVGALGGFSEEDGYWENDDYVVTFAVGHLFELPAPDDIDPKYKRWTLDTLPILPESFPLKAKSGTRDRLTVLRRLLKRDDVDSLVNACDAGREGELIFREIAEFFQDDKPIERLWLQSMTKTAIAKGFATLQPGQRFEGLSDAAYCRNYSDWLIGMNATRALTRRLKSRSENQAWSAGRVQTPTLAMLVDRELEVLQHVPAPYWKVHASFDHAGNVYRGTWFDPSFKSADDDRDGAKDDRIFDEAKAQAIAAKIAGKPGVARETRKPSNEAAPLLFDLTSLQREANRRFGWSARRTLNAAQRCYEAHKVLTYPRTDTKALPNDYREVVDDVVQQLQADARFSTACAKLQRDGRLNEQKIFDDAKVTDHFAIVPTGTLANLSGDDARVFDLVTRRFLAAFFPPAVWSRVERVTEVEGESFRSRARTLQVPGWREVLGDEVSDNAERLPPLVDGQDRAEGVGVDLGETEVEADETKPPARISESRLLSLMENAGREVDDDEAAEAMKESGIGTPATRADIIENLITKGYVARVGRGLKPSVKGIRLIDILRRMNAERLASPSLTGELEAHLGRVERGGSTRDAFMGEVYEYAKEIVELTKSFEFEDLYPNEAPLGTCPCEKKRPVYERSWFYRCEEPEGLDWQTIKEKRKKGEDVPEDCGFRIWKDKSGRYIDRKTVVELLDNGQSRPLDGFVQRSGRTYRGVLELTQEGVDLKPVEGGTSEEESGTPEYEVDDTPLLTCPVCSEGQIVETRSTFICSKGLAVLKRLERDEASTIPVKNKDVPEDMEHCLAILPRTVCKREITRDEAIEYFREGKTSQLEGFTSKRGRPFAAMLFLKKDENGRHGFEFPPRGGGEGAAKKKAPAKKKATAKKKSASKKKASANKKKSASKKKAPAKKKKSASKKKATAKKATAAPRSGAED